MPKHSLKVGPPPARSRRSRVSTLQPLIRPVLRSTALLLVALAVTGCAKPLYDWGSYESSVYRMYRDDDFSPAKEIDRLTREVAKTEAKGGHVPPGKYAHLAYLCYTAGDERQAEKYFLAEKAAFPESAVFVDGMLERMK